MKLPCFSTYIQSYVRHGSMDSLHSHRAIGRLLLIILAGNMLLQSMMVGLQVIQSVTTEDAQSELSVGTWSWTACALLVCHELWVVVSAVGGLAGFHAAWHYSIASATVCLRAWVALACVQTFQYLTVYAMLASIQDDKGRHFDTTLAWESTVLIAIEVVFIGFVYGYIVVLQEWQRQCKRQDGEGICLVPLHPATEQRNVLHHTNSSAYYGTTAAVCTTL
ncbi:hypothetical protein DYB31_008458 [Aphanomyces astaci]|uniref:Uncharacterized protein n=1 Tax=Aphanomyces astaci TaxID=112090 RepID=A0A397F6I4_APHAT|nr:hypothetical protein DYB31_008458 [Aphanomyces astaci]